MIHPFSGKAGFSSKLSIDRQMDEVERPCYSLIGFLEKTAGLFPMVSCLGKQFL